MDLFIHMHYAGHLELYCKIYSSRKFNLGRIVGNQVTVVLMIVPAQRPRV